MTTEPKPEKSPEFLKVEKHDPGILWIDINRPKALNALNRQVLTELRAELKKAAKDESIRVLVLSGEGEKAFIAGADIKEMKDLSSTAGVSFAKTGQEVTKLLQNFSKPTIAAVNGFALGGGCEMAISCDFIVACEKAVFGQPEVGLGIIPGFGATVRLTNFIGMPMAKELIFSGRKVKADEAKDIGLVNHVYPCKEFRTKTLELAKSISANSLSAVCESKKLMNEFSEMTGLDLKLDVEAQKFGGLFGSHDQREGMGAFVKKEKPKFEGLSS